MTGFKTQTDVKVSRLNHHNKRRKSGSGSFVKGQRLKTEDVTSEGLGGFVQTDTKKRVPQKQSSNKSDDQKVKLKHLY